MTKKYKGLLIKNSSADCIWSNKVFQTQEEAYSYWRQYVEKNKMVDWCWSDYELVTCNINYKI